MMLEAAPRGAAFFVAALAESETLEAQWSNSVPAVRTQDFSGFNNFKPAKR